MGISATLLVLLACTSTTTPTAAPTPAAPTAVKVQTVVGARATDVVEATGVVEVIDTVVVMPETAGVVSDVLFRDGDTVTKGQVLVRLRDADARAAVAEGQARFGLAEVALGRIRTLRAAEQVPQVELDQVQADRDLARAQLDRAQETLRRTTIVAPFGGVAGRREIAPGQVVSTSTAITRIEDLDPVTVDVALPEAALATVLPGQAAEVHVAALPGQTFIGELAYLSPRATASTRTFAARVRVPNPEHTLRPGLTANVTITTGEVDGAVVIPTYAVVMGATGAMAWVVDAEAKAQPRPLVLGRRGPDTLRVLEGLAVGDQLVVEGYTRLRPGAEVAIQPATPAAATPAATAPPAAPATPATPATP